MREDTATPMQYQTGEARLRRQRTKEAIDMAMQGRWEDAVAANQSIIEFFPKDIDAYNRLGKALTELGRYAEAHEAYSKALGIDPGNSIAKKNLRRLSLLNEAQPSPRGGRHRVSPHLFIEEMGKAGVASLYHLAPRHVRAQIAAGDPVYLQIDGQSIIVENKHGEYLGKVEPRVGVRLSNLIRGGNRYTAAVISSADSEVKIIIKEIFQHPSQAGRPSFPVKGPDGFRPYVRESILKYELEEEEERDYTLEWEEEDLGHVTQDIAILEHEEDSDSEDADHVD